MKNHRITKREYIRDLKTNKACLDCGRVYHYCIMEFDHVSGSKKFGLSDGERYSFNAIKDELSKCELVCANCHRMRTFKRKQHLNSSNIKATDEKQISWDL